MDFSFSFLFFFFFFANVKIRVMMACLQGCVFIPLYAASYFEILSKHRVVVCPSIYHVIRRLACHPSIVGFWRWKWASLGLIGEAHCPQEISAGDRKDFRKDKGKRDEILV